MAYEIVRFSHDGTIDADGHVLEPPDLWEQYLERRYRDRALRIRVDDDGYEYLEIGGQPSQRTNKGALGIMGAMGEADLKPRPDRRYAENIPYGACDPAERLDLMDRENLERALLYPTLGLLWECELEDPELSLAYIRAYNRWIADFCRHSGGRLVPIAQLTLLDPERSATELERAVADGCMGAWVNPFNYRRIVHGSSEHDVLFKTCCELDVPLAIHPTFTPHDILPGPFDLPARGDVLARQCALRSLMQQAFFSFIALDTFERFPNLRIGLLESGSGWIGPYLDRLDAVEASLQIGRNRPKPSESFKRQMFVSGDPDETAAPLLLDHVGAENFMWATDYPHPDHPHTWVHDLERYVEPLSAATREKVLGDNVRRVYRLH